MFRAIRKSLSHKIPVTILHVVLVSLIAANVRADEEVVDCHVHLWDTNRPDGIYWIKKDDVVLYRSFLPKDFEPIAKENGVGSVVIVQAGQHLPDNQWNLDMTAHNKNFYRGIVGNLSTVIGTDGFKRLFEKLCKDSRYVGYRLSGREKGGLSDAFYRDLEQTAKIGKTVDFLIGGYSLKDVEVIAKRVPDLKIILDHFGNVVLDGKPLDPEWVKDFRAAAKLPNVYCKVSALYGRVKEQPAPKDIGFYKPVLDLAFEAFGEDRLVFGSDWPVTRTSGDYASVLKLTKAYFDTKGERVTRKLFHENARNFYGIKSSGEGKVSALEKLKLPGVKINLEEKSVDVEATVCLTAGTLELIACRQNTKEHESILTINATAMHVHTALLLLGAKPGNPAMRMPREDGGWVDMPPSGALVDVFLVFQNESGKTVERPISDFLVTNTEYEAAPDKRTRFPTHSFLFAGSHLVGESDGPRQYVSDHSGNVISIATFGDELLCLPDVHSHENGSLLWQVDDTYLPAVDSKVTLRLRPQIEKESGASAKRH